MLSKKDKYLSAAQKFAERGQLEKALLELGKVVHDDPKDTRSWLKMAELHAKRGANQDAAEIYLRTGDLYAEQGFTQKAVAVYKNVLKLSPANVGVRQKLGALFKQMELSSDAVQQFELAAVGYQQVGRFGDAVLALRQAVELQPDNVVSRVNLAESASQANLVDEAVDEFGHAADTLLAAERVDEYIRVCERLLFHRPDDAARNRQLAEVYVRRGSARLALSKLQVCLTADPRDPATLALLATALEQLGQRGKAVSVLKELVRACDEAGQYAERNAALARGRALDPAEPEFRARPDRRSEPRSPWDVGPFATPPAARVASAASGGAWGGGDRDGGGTGRVKTAPAVGPDFVDSFEGLASGFSVDPSSDLSSDAPSDAPSDFPSGLSSTLDIVMERSSIDRDVSGRVRGTSLDVREVSVAPPSQDIARILAETDVFMKYELFERAAFNLARVFERDPFHREARELLISVLRRLGRDREAAREGFILADQLGAVAPAEAEAWVERARALERGDGVDPMPWGAAPSHEADVDVLTPPPVDPEDKTELSPVDEVTEETSLTPPPMDAGSAHDRAPEAAVEIEVAEDRASRAESARPAAGPARAEDRALELESDIATPILHPSLRVPLPGERRGAPAPTSASARASERDVATVIDREHVVLGADATFAHPDDQELEADLELASFFIDQGMFDDVDVLLEELAERFGRHPRLVEMDEELAAARHLVVDAGVGRHGPGGPGGRGAHSADPGADEDDVATAVIRMDGASDPGEAFRRLGQYDMAIEAYKRLTLEPAREVFALTKMGDCFQGKGTYTEAILRYKRALNCDEVTREETRLLYFQLGLSFEQLGDVSEALYFFEKVAKRDPNFHGVSRKIAELLPKKIANKANRA